MTKLSHRSSKHPNQAGFTLIELMVTMSLLTILMVSTTSLFILNLRSGARTSTRQELKQEGLFIMNQMEYDIKNSTQTPSSQCTLGGNPGNSFQFTNIQNEEFRYDFSSGNLSLTDLTTGNTATLNNDSVDVLVSGVMFNCFVNVTQEKFVEINFQLRRTAANTVGEISDDDVVEEFSKLVQLRN